jgi:hypothetical protein
MTDDSTSQRLESTSQRLESERPVPRPTFRGDLRRSLLAELESEPVAPPRLRLLIAAYAGSGLVLLAVAGVGLDGIGPLAA